jgi:predicted transcriptional regulator
LSSRYFKRISVLFLSFADSGEKFQLFTIKYISVLCRKKTERSDINISNTEQLNILRHYFNMMFPSIFRDNEYVRLIALRRDFHGNVIASKVEYVKTFQDYAAFVQKYRYTHDVYNQIATNRGKEKGTKSTQRQRKVLFLDFDKKDFPELQDASDFTKWIHNKLPKLYLHACMNSGHGFHFYVSIKPTCKIDEVAEVNKELVSILGSDQKAALPTQIDRVPCTYNHKQDDGSYDYENRDNWSYVKMVNNTYMVGSQFKQFDLPYIRRQMDYFKDTQETYEILDKVDWNYEALDDYPCYLCIRKVMNEGADEGQRNFWHGRIVKMLQMEAYTITKIHSICQEYNRKCRPPKPENIIEEDTNRFLDTDYKLLGCYESFPVGDKHREWIEAQCDKVYCGTYHNGAKISIEEGDAARINKKILLNRDLRTMTGNEYLIITLLDVYKNSFGRRGFRVKNLKEFLYSSVRKKQCIADRLLKTLLLELETKKWIEIVPDSKQPKKIDESKLKLTRRLKEFQQGFIEFYFSIAGALIDGRITQVEYIVFITLVRNLTDKKAVTYDQLAEDLSMDKNNIAKYIKKLQKERCLIIEKEHTDKGYECNKYHITSPEYFKNQSKDNTIPFNEENVMINIDDVEDKQLTIKLLA